MKKIISTFTIILLAVGLQAQTISGNWYGTLPVHGKQIRVVFHISKTGDVYTTTMDSPDQNVLGIPMDNTTVTGNQVTIAASTAGMKYTGTYLPDSNKINGEFSQGPKSMPLCLTTTETKVTKAATVPRPQDPKDYPYKQEEVVFTNTKAGNTLAGTLTMPADGKASKIVVLITGSGPQNRNEEIEQFNHRPFLVWSDWLTRNGIAVLRYDDRGVGASGGVFTTSTSADFADDAEAAVSYIQSRSDLKNLSIGLMGHSEGGMIAPMIASHNNAVKFIILLAGPGVPISQLMVEQTEDQLRLSGVPDSSIAQSAALQKKVFAIMNENKTLPADELKTKIKAMLNEELGKFPTEALRGRSADDMAREATTPWLRYFIAFDPAVYLTHTKCPVLAMDGTLDMQVRSADNLKAIKDCTRKAGNKNVQVVPMEGLNHMFQKDQTGSVPEYGQITETVNPAALDTATEWINKL